MASRKLRLRIRWERIAIILSVFVLIIFLIYSLIRSLFFTTRLPKGPTAPSMENTAYEYLLPNKISGNLRYGEQIAISLFTPNEKICGGSNTGIDIFITHLENEIHKNRYPLPKLSQCVDNLKKVSVRYEQINVSTQAAETYYLPIVYIYDGSGLLYNFTSVEDVMISNNAGYKFMGEDVNSILRVKNAEEVKRLKTNVFYALLLEGKVNLFDENISEYISGFLANQKQLLIDYIEGNYTDEQYNNLKRFNGHIDNEKLDLLISKVLKI